LNARQKKAIVLTPEDLCTKETIAMTADIQYTDDAQNALDQFLSFWPLVSRKRQLEKIEVALLAQLHQRETCDVNREILINALQDSHSSFETFISMLRDPAGIQAVMQSQKEIDTGNPVCTVTRWDLPKVPGNHPVKDVFALLAGPRTGGNTDAIMDAVLDGCRGNGCTVEKMSFGKLKITPCTGCLKCQDEQPKTYCAINDDMVPIYKRLLECDAFVLGYPVYTARESSQSTVFFDRLKALSNPWVPKKPEPKKGALVATWGWPTTYLYQDVVHNTAFNLRHFGVEIAEIVTGCGFWGAYYKRGSAALDKEGMEQARAAGRALCAKSV
jgi:multimeric flavodoxin WrbA